MQKIARQQILYYTKPIRSRTWKIVFALWVLAALVPTFFDNTTHSFYVNFLAYGITWGLPMILWAITLASINYYGTITITNRIFRVGRQEVLIDDIDTIALTAIPKEEVAFMDRLITSSDQISTPIKFLSSETLESAPIFGGAWGTPLAMDSFLLRLKNGKQYTVPLPARTRKTVIESLVQATKA